MNKNYEFKSKFFNFKLEINTDDTNDTKEITLETIEKQINNFQNLKDGDNILQNELQLYINTLKLIAKESIEHEELIEKVLKVTKNI